MKTAKALGKEINVSWKDCNEVCYNIKNKNVNKALSFLEKVIKKEQPVKYRRYNKGISHQKTAIGRYPIKAARAVKKVLENAKANAEHKGHDVEKLKITKASAYKSQTIERIKPRGRARTHNIELTNIEIEVREV